MKRSILIIPLILCPLLFYNFISDYRHGMENIERETDHCVDVRTYVYHEAHWQASFQCSDAVWRSPAYQSWLNRVSVEFLLGTVLLLAYLVYHLVRWVRRRKQRLVAS